MKSRRCNPRSKWAHVNTPDGLRRRRAKADARREAMAATLPPAYVPPAPGGHVPHRGRRQAVEVRRVDPGA